MTRRTRIEPPPVQLQTIQVTLRADEVELLTKVAKDQGLTRPQLLRSILRGGKGVVNPLPRFFDEVMKKELGR